MKKLKIQFNSPAVLGFVGMCFLAFLLDMMTGGWTTRLLFSAYYPDNASLRNLFGGVAAIFRLFGHVFGHSGWEHFAGNMMILLIIGPLLEEKYGTKNLLCVMVITAFVTGLVHIIFFPGTMLLGASGIVFAFILLSSFTSMQDGCVPATFLLVAAIYIGREVWTGIFVTDNISNLTHIIGGLIGSVCGMTKGRRI